MEGLGEFEDELELERLKLGELVAEGPAEKEVEEVPLALGLTDVSAEADALDEDDSVLV